MSDLTELLKREEARVRSDLQRAEEDVQKATSRRDSLKEEHTLVTSLIARRGGAPVAASIADLPITGPTATDNKTKFVLDYIAQHDSQGVTAGELKSALGRLKVSYSPNFPYRILSVLNKREKIKSLQGRWHLNSAARLP